MAGARWLLCFAACVSSCGVAFANNNLFLPGDSFFPTVLAAEKLGQLKADRDNPPIFEYSSLGGYEAAFCGYAGYQRAAFPKLDDAFISNLEAAYRRIREEIEEKQLVEIKRDDKTTLEETNGMRVLFYPRDFEFPKFQIGLRYNEKWVDEVLRFGHERRHARLCPLVDDANAVMESWRDATSVAALRASLPEIKLKPVPATTEPVTILDPVKAIALDSRPLIEYFRPDDDMAATVFIAYSSGIRELSHEDGTWVAKSTANEHD
jgi:hypothetical protein